MITPPGPVTKSGETPTVPPGPITESAPTEVAPPGPVTESGTVCVVTLWVAADADVASTDAKTDANATRFTGES